MPELPEVENVVRTLAPRLAGRIILRVVYRAPRAAEGRPAYHSKRLSGRKIVTVERRAKHIVLRLDRGFAAIHLRMTGKLLFEGARAEYIRAELYLDNGATLYFEDVRQFGYVRWCETAPQAGIDALDLTLEDLRRILRRRARLKTLLLNQKLIGGVGNIYADEALFRARLHPLTPAARVPAARAKRLLGAIQEVLREAIEAGGSSISDYVDAEGRAGSFQTAHRVYGREGKPCVVCGTAIRRMVVGQRGTHYCPRCQRA